MMDFTTDLPERPGWYFLRSKKGRIFVYRIDENYGRLVVDFPGGPRFLNDPCLAGCEWLRIGTPDELLQVLTLALRAKLYARACGALQLEEHEDDMRGALLAAAKDFYDFEIERTVFT